jgi:hypothetical protein
MVHVIAKFVVGVKDGWKKGKLAKLRLSYHCHLNRIALLFRVVGPGETSPVTWSFEKAKAYD